MQEDLHQYMIQAEQAEQQQQWNQAADYYDGTRKLDRWIR